MLINGELENCDVYETIEASELNSRKLTEGMVRFMEVLNKLRRANPRSPTRSSPTKGLFENISVSV